jgi:hypothetical protein
MTQTWQTHCYHNIFLVGTLYPSCIYQIDIQDHYMIPYVVLYTYWTYMLRYLTVGGPHAIYRIVIDDLYIHRIWSTKHCIRFPDINVPIGVLTDSYGYIGTSRRIYYIIYLDGGMTWLGRLTVSPRRDTDNHASEVTSYRPGRHILRLYRPIVTIWVFQTHIDTIGSIYNLYHPLSWRWYDFQCQFFSRSLLTTRRDIEIIVVESYLSPG